MTKLSLLLMAISLIVSSHTNAWAGDSHADYYYPQPESSEVYVSAAPALPDANKRSRVGFTVGLNQQQLKRPHQPQYHIFAKGHSAKKLIIVASGDAYYNTLYRMRALLAALTSQARLSPMFQEQNNPEDFNFLDMVRMIGFTQVTVSDGDKFAHRINLQ